MKIDFKPIPTWEKNPFLGLLDQYMFGKITEEEFHKELAYGALDSIDKLQYDPEPMEPDKVLELRALKATTDWKSKRYEDREKIEQAVYKIPSVKEFADQVTGLRTKNDGNLYWLKKYLSWIPDEDIVNQRRIVNAIRTHDRSFSWPGKRVGVSNAERNVPVVSESGGGTAPQITADSHEPEVIPPVSGEHIQRCLPVQDVSCAEKARVEHKPGSRGSLRGISE